MTDPDIILLNDPTRGIDVGTKQEIFRMMRELADEGKSILFYSLGLCRTDRLLLTASSCCTTARIVRELTGDAITEEAIVAASLNIGEAA